MADNRAEENSNSDDDSDDVSALDDLNEDQRQTLVQFQVCMKSERIILYL